MMKKTIVVILVLALSCRIFSQNIDPVEDIEYKIRTAQYDSAIIAAKHFIGIDSTSSDLYYYLGTAYQSKYNFFNAEKAYLKANQLDTLNPSYQNALADIYEILGKDEDAINIYYDQYLLDTLNIIPITKLANIFRKKREYGSAIHYYQKAIILDPGNFYNYKLIAYCFNQINIKTPAILYYGKALELNPYDQSTYGVLANILNSERLFTNAISICKKGLEIYSQDVSLKRVLAYSYYLNREFGLSIDGFNELISNGDSLLFNFKYQGLAYFENKDFTNAIHALKIAFDKDDKDTEITFYLGSALGRSGEHSEGIRFLLLTENLLSSPPGEMASVFSELANIELLRENYQKSLEYLKLAYKYQAEPLLSFKMAQLYDNYLSNKKLAMNYYDGYLTMLKEIRTDSLGVSGNNAINSQYQEIAKQRIQILTEELFFESAK
ncbi:MAG TPA: hypothetical protein DCQ24_15015 [Bacteroidales bacterium]|nr:hypothetical protein [Bacteroidales bacterium]